MDGNGRWAEMQGMQRWQGHLAGSENLESIFFHAVNCGIEVLTVYSLSLDNIDKRLDEEKNHLFHLFFSKLDYAKRRFNEENTRITFIGDPSKLPIHIQEKAKEIEEATKQNTRGTLVVAMAYGGRDEIIRATKKAREAGSDDFTPYLDTHGLPPLDLIIRTGVENPIVTRLSDFLIWQAAYSEIYSTATYWPAFTPDDFDTALEVYSESERKFGAVIARKDWGGF